MNLAIMFLTTYLISRYIYIEMTINSITDAKTKDTTGNNFQGFPIDTSTFQELQHDSFCKNIFSQIEKGNMQEGQLYIVRDKILKRYVTDGNNIYETTVIPRALMGQDP